MHRTRALAVLVTTLLLRVASLDAQTIPSPYQYIETGQEAGAFVGYAKTGTGTLGLGPKSGLLFGLRYGVEVSGPFGLEGAASFLPTQRDVIDPRQPELGRVRGEADMSLLLAEARLRFSVTGRRTWHSLNPFVFLGAGGAYDFAGSPELDAQLRESDRFDFGFAFVGVLGGGVRWMLSERFLARGDAQLTLWQIDTPDGYQDPVLNLGTVPASEWANNGLFSIGLAYRF
jgi:hypothetical protein